MAKSEVKGKPYHSKYFKPEIRICEDCGKKFWIHSANQKRCSECNQKRREEAFLKSHCPTCGRSTSSGSYDDEGHCSFCTKKIHASIITEREMRDHEKFSCKICHRSIPKSNPQLLTFRRCTMCFESKNRTPECPKCKVKAHVHLSQEQVASEPNFVVWYCDACDFAFVTLFIK